jgi:hypothetical protein
MEYNNDVNKEKNAIDAGIEDIPEQEDKAEILCYDIAYCIEKHKIAF